MQGRYEFHRDGIPEGIPYRRFMKREMVTIEGYIPLVGGHFDTFAAQYYIASARITPHDEKALQRSIR